jgi:hypothetical protein
MPANQPPDAMPNAAEAKQDRHAPAGLARGKQLAHAST